MNDTETSPERPLMERVGLAYFRKRKLTLGKVQRDDAVHVLNEGELRKLRRIEQGVVIRAGLVGAGSALVTALAELSVRPLFGIDSDSTAVGDLIRFWAWVGGVTLVATIGEIGFLYWDALRSVHALSRAAGMNLFASGREEASATAISLARAALELPNPPKGPHAIDPHRESPR